MPKIPGCPTASGRIVQSASQHAFLALWPTILSATKYEVKVNAMLWWGSISRMYANRAAAAQTISNKNKYVDKLLLSSILRSDHSVAGLFLSSVSLLSAEIATGINGEIFPWCICLAQCFCCFRLMLTKLSYNNLLHTHTHTQNH